MQFLILEFFHKFFLDLPRIELGSLDCQPNIITIIRQALNLTFNLFKQNQINFYKLSYFSIFMVIKKDCIFCKITAKEIPKDFIYENANFVSFLDDNPRVKGHTLIIPKKHYVNSFDLPSSLGVEFLDTIKNVAEIHSKDKDVGGFNLLQNNFPVAGQVVMHFHLHFLPRREGDGFTFFG